MNEIEQMNNILINDLFSASEDFLVKLRMGEGFDEQSYEILRRILTKIDSELKQSETIPKKIANILVDLYPSIEACSYQYTGDLAERILKAADETADLTREIVSF